MIKTEYLQESKMFPEIILARLFDAQDRSVQKTAVRTAQCYELSIYLTETGSLIVNGVTHKLKYGGVRFIKPGSTVCSTPPFRCFTINFHLGEPGVNYRNELLDAIPEFFYSSSEQIPAFKQIVKHFTSSKRGSILIQNALLLQLLADFFHCFHSESSYCSAVVHCISYMKNHFNEEITLDFLGHLTGYSPLHVLRIFKADTGKTPHEFLTDLRIFHAKELLLDTSEPVFEIAASCGFRSDSHFKALFKKITGINPGIYRKISQTMI